eukprot:scaffold12470_cov119-Isochrysis_galbana.AAC.5
MDARREQRGVGARWGWRCRHGSGEEEGHEKKGGEADPHNWRRPAAGARGTADGARGHARRGLLSVDEDVVKLAVGGGQALQEEQVGRRVVEPPVLGHLADGLDAEGGHACDHRRLLRQAADRVEPWHAERVEHKVVGVHDQDHVGSPGGEPGLDAREVAGVHLGLKPAAAVAQHPVGQEGQAVRRRHRVRVRSGFGGAQTHRRVNRVLWPHDEHRVAGRGEIVHMTHHCDGGAVDLGPPRVGHIGNPHFGANAGAVHRAGVASDVDGVAVQRRQQKE